MADVEEVLSEKVVPKVFPADTINVHIAGTDKSKIKIGIVKDCSLLNVRKAANKKSDVLFLLERGTQVKVILEDSTPSYYKVLVNKAEGFCSKEYILVVEV